MVLFILNPLVDSEMVLETDIRKTNSVDHILAYLIDGHNNLLHLILHLFKICVEGVLQVHAFGFYTLREGVPAHQPLYFLNLDYVLTSDVRLVEQETLLAASHLGVLAGRPHAEKLDLFVVLAFYHLL